MASGSGNFPVLGGRPKSGLTAWRRRRASRISPPCPAIGRKPSRASGKAGTASASMTNGGFASSGPKAHPARSRSRLLITTDGGTMARTPIHPGEHLAEELKELGLSAAELSRQIDVPVNRVTAILNGQRGITADTALRLGHWFGTSPEFWLNLQTLYELRSEEHTSELQSHVNLVCRLL